MEIDGPESPIRSLKDFLIHIAMVTLGILIAFSLEGVREMLHHRHVIEEAWANFRSELNENRTLLTQYGLSAAVTIRAVQELLNDLPQAERDPKTVESAIEKMGADFVVLKAAARDTALSTGALSLMEYGEVRRYANAYTAQRAFEEMEGRLETIWYDLSGFEDVVHLSAEQKRTAASKLRIALTYLHSLQQLQQQAQNAYDEATRSKES